jgi:general secretion pathway protein E
MVFSPRTGRGDDEAAPGNTLTMPAQTTVSYQFARTNGVLVVDVAADGAQVVVRASSGGVALAELKREFGVPLKVTSVSDAEFEQRLAQVYERAQIAGGLEFDVAQDAELARLAQELPRTLDLLDTSDDAPIVRLINALLVRALRERASDLHFEPSEARSTTRFRVDGMLRDVLTIDRTLHAALISRIKIMANLDIAEKRLPQDGRISVRLAGRPVDVRVSTLPTGHGERAVLRLLDKQSGRLDLARLGMSETTLDQIEALVRAPQGIVLVTGPTGSGKTTTLYAALDRVDTARYNVMTVEDPIEYDLTGISQTQVNARIGMSFARALRSILRQDPDVIMIGEIRDQETAQVAIQASLTGHLVLATLHTNDACSSVTRLLDMGVEPYLLASSLLGVAAQRLVRLACPECAERVAVAPEALERHGVEADTARKVGTLVRVRGCTACNGSGYRGRSGIYEVLTMNDALRALIHARAPEAEVRLTARRAGMTSLRDDGMRWVASGATTFEEVLRATSE